MNHKGGYRAARAAKNRCIAVCAIWAVWLALMGSGRRGLVKPMLSNLINPQTEVSIRIRLDHELIGLNSFDHVYEAHSCNQAELEKFQS